MTMITCTVLRTQLSLMILYSVWYIDVSGGIAKK